MAPIQYLTTAPTGYILPSDATTVETFTNGATLGLHQPLTTNGLQKLVAIQPARTATALQTGVLQPQVQKVVTLPQTRTFAGGATFVHQAAVQPRMQQLPANTQIINAYNAEGQPVTIAINPNGGAPTVLNTAVHIPQATQQVQVRQMPATAVLSQAPGQRIVHLANGADLSTTNAPGIYKVVQQGTSIPAAPERYIVQTAQGQQVVQRVVQAPSAVPLKHAAGMQQVAVRSAAAPMATVVPGGIQMGRSLIHMPNRATAGHAFTTAGTTVVANNANVLTVAKMPTTVKQTVKPLQHVQQLPSTLLVKPPGDASGPQAGTVLPAQSLQQQVKDTAAQQRQQQLLAGLRARVASLQQGQSAVASTASQQSQSVTAQLQRLVAASEQAQNAAGTSMHLQPDVSSLANGFASNSQQLDAQTLLSLTPAQQQALLSGQSLDSLLAGPQLSADNLSLDQTLRQLLQDSNNTLLQQQLLDLPAAVSGQDQALANRLALSGLSGTTEQLSLTSSIDSKLLQNGPLTQPTSPSSSVGKEDLRAILLSIGVELARHGIDVQTAVDAGWLGVLSPTDVTVLQEAYAQEERRLASETRSLNGDEQRSTAGAGDRALTGFSMGSNSHNSPAHSIASAPAADSAWQLSEPPMHLTEIDDARFSAFAYDFFGSSENGAGVASDCLEALEPDTRSVTQNNSGGGSTHSSFANATAVDLVVGGSNRSAPQRAPSWPPAKEGSGDSSLQVDNKSLTSFSDTCAGGNTAANNNGNNLETASDAVSTTSSSNQELVARIANLDLGCGFY